MENNIEKNNEIEEEILESEEFDEAALEAEKKKFPLWIIISAVLVCAAIVALIVIMLGKKDNGTGNNVTPDSQPPLTEEGGDDSQDPKLIDYTVTILDDLNNPASDVIVKFTDKDGVTKIKKTGQDGKASLTGVLPGDYSIIVDAAASKVTVSNTEFVLSESNNNLVVYARNNDDSVEISGDVTEDSYAHTVTTGDFSVHTKTDETTFLYFKPTESGIYHFTITSSVSDSTIGYR